jgi:two-component system copper resistance phosphate regulon response regulator CusR
VPTGRAEPGTAARWRDVAGGRYLPPPPVGACVVRVLVVEDELAAVQFLERGLTEEGFSVEIAFDAQGAREAVGSRRYDAIILDVMLPGEDGFALCRAWRDQGLETPILFLTARDDVAERVRGLTIGGDDYLVKPFAFAELLARLRVVARRGHGAGGGSEIRVGDLVVDTARRRVMRGGQEVLLTAREYRLLEHLAARAGRVVSRSELWEHVWESQAVPDSNVIDVYVRYLRNKLGREPDLIRTVRGGGYVLEAEPLTGGRHADGASSAS